MTNEVWSDTSEEVDWYEDINRKTAVELMRGLKVFLPVSGTEYLIRARQTDIIELIRDYPVDAIHHPEDEWSDEHVVFWPRPS